jgi:flagellin
MGRLQAQVGADENQIELLRIPKSNSEMLYLDDISFKSSEDTDKALDKMDKAIDKISSFRSHIGAMTNRIDYTVSYLDENAENMESSVSTIADTDMAEEMTEYTTQNVLVQSATAMLAQANDAPEQLLSLLQ